MDWAYYGLNGWGILWLKWIGHIMAEMGEAFYGLNGIYGSNGWHSYCFCSKNTGLQRSTPSGPRMTTGFSPFELPTRRLLQKSGTTPHLRFVLRSFWLDIVLNRRLQCNEYSRYYTIGGGAQWVELSYY